MVRELHRTIRNTPYRLREQGQSVRQQIKQLKLKETSIALLQFAIAANQNNLFLINYLDERNSIISALQKEKNCLLTQFSLAMVRACNFC